MLGAGPDAACRDALARWGVPAAVVGVLGGGDTDVRSYGVTALPGGVPLRPETTFRLASITKPFTATLALLLADDGLLALDEPVSLPLPDDRVTLRHLLSHLGGFEGEAGDLARFGEGDDALGAAVGELASQPQVVPPGTIWSYCNAGYWAAGRLCADAAGTTFEDALRDRVLEPLGLTSTGFGEPEARGHDQVEPGSPLHAPARDAGFPRARRPSGGLVSNAPDLLRFAALQLSDERLVRLREPQAETPDGAYGLGWARERVAGVDVWSHAGSYGGFRTLLALVPERQVAFAILTNGAGGEAVVREVSNALLAEHCGAGREPPPTVPLARAELERLAGSYANPEVEAAIAANGTGLALDVVEISPFDGLRTPLPRLEARPVGTRTFAIVGGQWADERFDFVPADGLPRFVRIGSRLAARC